MNTLEALDELMSNSRWRRAKVWSRHRSEIRLVSQYCL